MHYLDASENKEVSITVTSHVSDDRQGLNFDDRADVEPENTAGRDLQWTYPSWSGDDFPDHETQVRTLHVRRDAGAY
jgi:hypothetical protein